MLIKNTLSTSLRRWSDNLQTASDSPQLDAQILLKFASGMSDVELIIEADKPLSETIILATEQLIARRKEGTPIAYIVGEREFYSLRFKVNKHVLIPRSETELLVELAQQYIDDNTVKTVLDLGTGSGAITISLAKYNPNIQFIATDCSHQALIIAQENAQKLEVNNITFILSDWYNALKQAQFDLIVSNPPYIDPEDAHLQQGDVRFEPNSALVAKNHGLAALENIILSAEQHLRSNGCIILEHGYNQKSAVQRLLKKHSFKNVETTKDLASHDRITSGTLN